LGPSWGHIGQGREDGKQAGEYSPIFFRTDRWLCENSRTYWLSETPDIPSKGWDAALERIVTIGSFRHKETETAAVVMSTHLDHQGEVAREQSARLLLQLARTWVIGREVPAPLFLGGDLNSTPDGGAYKVLTEPGEGMKDISTLVPEHFKYGNQEITYTSFGEQGEEPKQIDFLFVLNPERLNFLGFSILANQFDDQIYLSDHRPVVVDLEIPCPSDQMTRS
jgi:endonuclease/exonuclease/phosphatase family metal-dependent hydrolase